MSTVELNSVNTVSSPKQKPSSGAQDQSRPKRSLRQQYVHNKSQLLNLCNLIMDNQDILVRQMVVKILTELNETEKGNDIRRFSAVESKPAEIFDDMECDDENTPLARTPEEIKVPDASSNDLVRREGIEERRQFVIDRMWSNPIYPEEEIRTIPKTTILSAMLNLQESTMVNVFVGMRRIAPIISLIYTLYFVIFYLTIFGTIRPEYSWITLICYPVVLIQLSLTNLYLVKRLLRNFETWFLLLQAFMIVIVLVDMLRGDVRCICVGYLFLLQIGLIFVDAALVPPDERIINLLIALSSIIVNVVTLYVGLWQNGSKTITFSGYTFAAGDFLAQRNLTLVFFTLKHIISAYRHPDCFVILTSRLTMLHAAYKT